MISSSRLVTWVMISTTTQSQKFHSVVQLFNQNWPRFSRKKTAVLLDFVQMNGEGEGPAQIFCHLFISAFLVNNRSLFPPKCQ